MSALPLPTDSLLLGDLTKFLQPSDQDRQAALTQGLLAAGLGMLANNRSRNASPAIGQGGLLGLQAYQGSLGQSRQDAMQRLQMGMMADRLRKEQERERSIQSLLNPQGMTPGQAASLPGGPTNENAAMIGQPQGPNNIGGVPLDIARTLYATGGPDALAKFIADYAKPTDLQRNVRGLPQADAEFATRHALGIAPKPTQLNRGGSIDLGVQDPRTGAFTPSSSMPMTAAPGAIPFELSDLTPPEARGFKLQNSAAGAARQTVLNNNFEPAKEAMQRQGAQQVFKDYETLKNAPDALAGIERAKKLIPKSGTFVGSGAEQKLAVVQFLNQNLGTNIRPEEAANAEVLRSLTFRQVIDNLKKMDSQPSERQQEALRQAMGTLGTDPRALGRVLDVTADIIRTRVSDHNARVKQLSDKGITPGYDVSISIPGTVMRFDANGNLINE